MIYFKSINFPPLLFIRAADALLHLRKIGYRNTLESLRPNTHERNLNVMSGNLSVVLSLRKRRTVFVQVQYNYPRITRQCIGTNLSQTAQLGALCTYLYSIYEDGTNSTSAVVAPGIHSSIPEYVPVLYLYHADYYGTAAPYQIVPTVYIITCKITNYLYKITCTPARTVCLRLYICTRTSTIHTFCTVHTVYYVCTDVN